MLLIPICAFSFFFLIRYDNHKNVLRATIDSGVIFCALTVFAAEFLSIFSAYRPIYVLLFWLIVSTVCILKFRTSMMCSVSSIQTDWKRMFTGNKLSFKATEITTKYTNSPKERTKGSKKRVNKLAASKKKQAEYGFSGFEYAAFAIIGLLCFGTLTTALMYPPTNYDSLVFHLPRVFYWVKNGSVHNFPTNVARQLFNGPFNAFAMLQIFTLSHGSDLFLNLSQWVHYIGAIIVSALIAAELGLNRRWQTVSALLTATVPLCILQANTTQNDLTAAFWCVVSIYYVLRLINDRQFKNWIETGMLLGLSLGIAILTKTNTVLVLIPFAVMFICLRLRKKYLKSFLCVSGIVICCVVFICVGFFIRNAVELDGDFLALGAPEISLLKVETLSGNYRLALLTKNLLYTFGGMSRTDSAWVYNIVSKTCSLLGVDINDPSITTSGYSYRVHSSYFDHDAFPNGFHSLLILSSFILFVVFYFINKNKKDEKVTIQLMYSIAVVASYVAVASNFKWTFSATRYLLPSLLLAIPFCAFVLSLTKITRLAAIPVLICAVGLSAGPLLFKYHQPLINDQILAQKTFKVSFQAYEENASRKDKLATGLITKEPYFLDAAEEIIIQNDITQIGIAVPYLATYPILDRFWDDRFDAAYIFPRYHIINSAAFTPQAIFDVRPNGNLSPIELNGKTYVPVLYSPSVQDLSYVFYLDEEYGIQGDWDEKDAE